MRYGHTSIINFLSRLVMSFSGFVATIALTRTLGQDRYGTYVVVLSVLAWVVMAGKLGLPQAIRKRVSERSEGNYVAMGLFAQFGLYAIVAVCLWIARHHLNEFIGIEATLILIMMLGVRLILDVVRSILDGQHLVHVSSILSPIEWTGRSFVQVTFVLSGFGIIGAFAGYIVGAVVATAIGTYFVTVPQTLPSRQDLYNLKSYAQFSWLGSIRGRTFLSMDTIILAFFVSNSLVAVYEIAWNLASLFAIFGSSISQTLFPAMSKISSEQESDAEIARLLRISLAFTGLFIVPGFVGSALVGDIILTIYGSGFDTGYYLLFVLTFARLLYGYMGQFLSTINAVDRPDLTFYINAVFVVVNLVLNIILTWQFGWYGAATATTISAGLGLVLGYYYASQIINVVVPFGEIAKQWIAAGIMAIVVLAGRLMIGSSLPIVVILVVVGSVVYFGSLFVLSHEFRITVYDNLPFELPVLVE